MGTRKDHYAVLGVDRDASPGTIRKAFRNRAKGCHPDCAGPEREDEFKELAAAHEVLSDPELRRGHDDELAAAERREAAARSRWPAPRAVAEPLSPERDRGAWWTAGRAPLRDVPPAAARPSSRSRAVLALELVLSPLEALLGGRVPLVLRLLADCPGCLGRGGYLTLLCPECRGAGVIPQLRRLELPLPPGLRQGSVLEVALSPDDELSPLQLELLVRVDPFA